jgi:signal peptidase I
MSDAVENAALVAVSDIAPDDASSASSSSEAGADRTRGGKRAKTGRRARRQASSAGAVAWDAVRTVALALLLSFGIRVVLVEPFHIPSQSMEPTLRAGDYIGAAKYPYGWSRVSAAPLALPMIPGRLFGRDPSRGEMVVFRNQLDGGADYIKRVIGLPGDRVQMRNGVLLLNGVAARTELSESYEGVDPSGEPVHVEVFEETIPGGCAHLIQHYTYADGRQEGQDDTYEFQVPEGHFFVLGDNRDASYDSRLPGRVGYVPAAEIIGRAEFVFFSFGGVVDLQARETWTNLRTDRMLKPLICG